MLAVRITATAQGKEGGKGAKVQGKVQGKAQGKVQGKVQPAVGWVRPRLRVKPTAVVHDELCGIVERSPRGPHASYEMSRMNRITKIISRMITTQIVHGSVPQGARSTTPGTDTHDVHTYPSFSATLTSASSRRS